MISYAFLTAQHHLLASDRKTYRVRDKFLSEFCPLHRLNCCPFSHFLMYHLLWWQIKKIWEAHYDSFLSIMKVARKRGKLVELITTCMWLFLMLSSLVSSLITHYHLHQSIKQHTWALWTVCEDMWAGHSTLPFPPLFPLPSNQNALRCNVLLLISRLWWYIDLKLVQAEW